MTLRGTILHLVLTDDIPRLCALVDTLRHGVARETDSGRQLLRFTYSDILAMFQRATGMSAEEFDNLMYRCDQIAHTPEASQQFHLVKP